MIIQGYKRLNLDHMLLNLDPDLIEGSRVIQLDYDNADNTVYVEIVDGFYEGTCYWFPQEMVVFD